MRSPNRRSLGDTRVWSRRVSGMANGDERQELEELARELFGGTHIPPAYVRALKCSTDGASARLGIVINSNERRAYWLDGRSLGILSCTGITDDDARISGEILQLDHLVSVKLNVAVRYDRFNNVSDSGRVLAIEDFESGHFTFDASPQHFNSEKRDEIERFIDQVLAALAGR